MKFSNSKTSSFNNNCVQCGAALLDNAFYCGKCGYSMVDTSQGAPSTNTIEKKSLWKWISPVIRLWVLLLAINGVLGLSGHLLDISSPYFVLSAQVLSALIILIQCFKACKQLKPLLQNFGFRGLLSYLEIIGSLVFIFIFMWLYFKLLFFIGIEEMPYLTDFREHNWPMWSVFILICFLPGIFEELAFRGYIMSRLEKVGNAREALIIQAAMFSILHMHPAIFISHFVIGLIIGAVRLKSGSLYPGMLIHITWNAIVVIEEAYQML